MKPAGGGLLKVDIKIHSGGKRKKQPEKRKDNKKTISKTENEKTKRKEKQDKLTTKNKVLHE